MFVLEDFKILPMKSEVLILKESLYRGHCVMQSVPLILKSLLRKLKSLGGEIPELDHQGMVLQNRLALPPGTLQMC